jgi:hypothetical protein
LENGICFKPRTSRHPRPWQRTLGYFSFETELIDAPNITDLRVVPVAGKDSMLLNLSGADGTWFTRNIVILTDSAGNMGLDARDDAAATQFLVPGWKFNNKRPCPVR